MTSGGLDQPVATLRGAGPAAARRLARLGIYCIRDLLLHFPRDYQDRRNRDRLADAAGRERANVLVRVRSRTWIGGRSPRVLKVIVEDESARASLLCFGRPFLYAQLLPDRRFWVYGAFRLQGGELQAGSFDLEAVPEPSEPELGRGPIAPPAGAVPAASVTVAVPAASVTVAVPAASVRILPVYPLTDGLSQKLLRRLTAGALEAAAPLLGGQLGEQGLPTQPPRSPMLGSLRLPGRVEALRELHFPSSWDCLGPARLRLVYEQYLHEQLELGRSRRERLSVRRCRTPSGGALRDALLARLPFALTAGQQRALAEIQSDLAAPQPAARLLQGEVGCGKTLVALLAALGVIESGEQVAYLAPTELLARQQADTAARLLEPLGVRVALLSGVVRGAARAELLGNLAGGAIDLLVGTHALFSPEVRYRRLGLAVVDEQHRFGVEQRQALLGKGEHPDLLLMTATPIPRTLALSAYGDLELSEIRQMPSGRKPVITHLTREGNEAKVYQRVRREIAAGGQGYFVYPLIEESDSQGLKNAEGMYRILASRVFPGLRLGLIHSRVAEEDKLRVMADFAAGGVDILVATSVLEVGVDVPGATCIVVEHAERFGLSTLHQLRGRVGRGGRQAYAFLIYSRELTAGGLQRLKAVMSTTDGFRLAEEDLRIRGPGELLGLRQAGYERRGAADPRLGVPDIQQDWELLVAARADAAEILGRDPGLRAPAVRALRDLWGFSGEAPALA